jgi:hypothetical protein
MIFGKREIVSINHISLISYQYHGIFDLVDNPDLEFEDGGVSTV